MERNRRNSVVEADNGFSWSMLPFKQSCNFSIVVKGLRFSKWNDTVSQFLILERNKNGVREDKFFFYSSTSLTSHEMCNCYQKIFPVLCSRVTN